MKALLVVCFCLGVVFGQQIGQDGYPSQLSQPIGNLPDPNPREATERDLPQVPRTLVTTIHMVLEDGGPPSRTPDIHSSSCGSYSMRPGGVATLVSYNGSGGCSASISLPGFQTLRVETTAVHHPVTVMIRRIGADVDGVADGPISASMLAMPVAAHKAYGEGEIAMGLGHWVDAAGWFRKAVAEYPAHMLAWDELGLALQKLNQTADAKAAWEKALLADPTFARACIHLAILAIQEQRPADAAELTARALRAPGLHSTQALYYDAVANFATGHFSRAESSARQTIRQDDTHRFRRAEYILGMALAQGTDFSGAAEHLRSYLELEPQGEFAAAARHRLTELESRAKR